MVFAGVGFVSLPMDLIREFVGRPRSTIPRSEYINRAMVLSARAVQIKVDPFPSPSPPIQPSILVGRFSSAPDSLDDLRF